MVHCRPEPSIVRIGDHDLHSHDDDSSPQDINIANMILHPNYTSKSVYNDIALLHLATTVRYNILYLKLKGSSSSLLIKGK